MRPWKVNSVFDYWQIGSNILWIFGLALLLAAWSSSYYESHLAEIPVFERLRSPKYDVVITLGLVLICAGLAAIDTRWWARLIWILLGIFILISWIIRRREPA
jgi:glucan phosphoethanolaminetransferase (alkaline phosphatase superfamily)